MRWGGARKDETWRDEWHPAVAWYPVRCIDGTWVLGEVIERKRNHCPEDGGKMWDWRATEYDAEWDQGPYYFIILFFLIIGVVAFLTSEGASAFFTGGHF